MKIFYNLKESVFKFDTGKIEFYFSTELNLKKFRERIIENRKKINESLSNRFSLEIVNENLSDIILYRKIEKRGFLIVNDRGEKIEWPNQIKLNGEKLIKKESRELQDYLMQR